jgi:transcriptional regulator with XRE-family HTH domain
MSGIDFRARLKDELARRRRVNRRYSLRAFAAFLGIDHSTLSQMLRGRRPLPADRISDWAARLSLGTEQARVCVAAAQADNDALAKHVLRAHWVGEAAAVLDGPAHWRLLELTHAPDFRPDSRWIAVRIGTSVDDVNDALTRLLRLGLLSIERGVWRDISGVDPSDEIDLKELALSRVRAAVSAD